MIIVMVEYQVLKMKGSLEIKNVNIRRMRVQFFVRMKNFKVENFVDFTNFSIIVKNISRKIYGVMA